MSPDSETLWTLAARAWNEVWEAELKRAGFQAERWCWGPVAAGVFQGGLGLGASPQPSSGASGKLPNSGIAPPLAAQMAPASAPTSGKLPIYGCSCGCGASEEARCFRTPGWISVADVPEPGEVLPEPDEPQEGEVTCGKCGNRRLDRTDLNCWRCGAIEELERGRFGRL